MCRIWARIVPEMGQKSRLLAGNCYLKKNNDLTRRWFWQSSEEIFYSSFNFKAFSYADGRCHCCHCWSVGLTAFFFSVSRHFLLSCPCRYKFWYGPGLLSKWHPFFMLFGFFSDFTAALAWKDFWRRIILILSLNIFLIHVLVTREILINYIIDLRMAMVPIMLSP